MILDLRRCSIIIEIFIGLMGNEGSQPVGLEIEEKAVEATDAWTLHYGNISGGMSRLSVFVGQSQEGRDPPALELLSKNLMLYRHPSIVRYISSWQRGDSWNLATEEVKPLAQVLSQLTPIQVCLGLHNILKALVFLHDKAKASHNNVCCSSIYISPDGAWKLCGFENLCRYKDLTPEFLQRIRHRRYERAIAPEEEDANNIKTMKELLMEPWAIDTFAFGVLGEEVLRPGLGRAFGAICGHELPALSEFKDLLKKHLQNSVPSLRAKLSFVLNHPFFSHPLISIHGFLIDLPLKTETEKEDFFRHLPCQLFDFPEVLVAIHLGALLLSRMVLINSSAQEYLIPRMLNPRPDGISKVQSAEEEDLKNNTQSLEALFSLSTFREHLAPRLLQIFGVRDAQIRLILLKHFHGYCGAFSDESLRTVVLPELLVGIKDTNDALVSTTLHALAELVPLLGARTVIGGKRGKLFSDGRPKQRIIPSSGSSANSSQSQSSNSIGNISVRESLSALSTSIYPGTTALVGLPERPSPDGGEEKEKVDIEAEENGLEEVVVDWSDWDAPEEEFDASTLTAEQESMDPESLYTSHSMRLSETEASNKVNTNDSTKEKCKVVRADEEDFFKDMEPVISKTQILRIEDPPPHTAQNISSPLNAIANLSFDSTMEESGWGEDLEWGDEELNIR